MQHELNQEEIDAMVRAARSSGRAKGRKTEPRIEHWDVRRAGQIGREQLHAITQLHEGFARSLTHSLGAYLRVDLTATLVSAEHLTFREFLDNIPETTYLASFKLEPMGLYGALQLDLRVALPIVDLLLGGEGGGVVAVRDITEIEEQIVESVARIICRDLATAWQEVEVAFEKRMAAEEVRSLLPPDEKMLSLSFEITLLEVRGGFNLAVPVAVSRALVRKISAERTDRRPRGSSASRERLKLRLLECPFFVELEAKDLRAEVGELSELAAGQLLPLRGSANQPASLMVAGVEMFRAVPVRSGDIRAAQVLSAAGDAAAASEVKEAGR